MLIGRDAGQSHLIFGIGSTGYTTKSRLPKLCSVGALYKPSQNVDAIALGRDVLGERYHRII